MVWCRRKRISTVVDLETFSRFTALLSFFSGARSRIGFSNFHDEGLYRGNLVNKPVRYNPHVHIATNFMSLTNRALGLFSNHYATTPVSSDEIKLEKAFISTEELCRVKTRIKELYAAWTGEFIVLVNVNASDMLPQRRWPRENFVLVARSLLENFENVLILATGAPAEKEYVEDVVTKVSHKKCINSAGYFSFDELVPLYSISQCMLTNDSGPAHFASVTDLKVFVLFGPETPHLYLPLGGNAEPFYQALPCSPCVSASNHRKTSCTTTPCIVGITPSTVFSRIKTYLIDHNVF
jgi:ADP-heptose:LPS heptosyltransferase